MTFPLLARSTGSALSTLLNYWTIPQQPSHHLLFSCVTWNPLPVSVVQVVRTSFQYQKCKDVREFFKSAMHQKTPADLASINAFFKSKLIPFFTVTIMLFFFFFGGGVSRGSYKHWSQNILKKCRTQSLAANRWEDLPAAPLLFWKQNKF